MKSSSLSFALLGWFGLVAGCSSSPGPSGTGGSVGTGGTVTGGSTGTGGSATGGSSGTGGSATGGSSGTGGSATGGSTGTGGSATGGSTGTGGSATGGNGSGGNGSGGKAGGGGSSTGGAAGGSAGAAGGCAAGLAFCDNFDSQSAGSAPDVANWTMVGGKTCSTQGPSWPFAVDSTVSHSPPNSMKVQGGDSCGPLMVHTGAFTIKLDGSNVYGRFYVRLSDTSMTFDHAFLMALGLNTSTINPGNQGSFLQLASEGAGNATNVFMWQTSDGNILPDKNASGGATSTYPKANTWTCVEFHTLQATGALETWVDGTAVSGLTFVPGTTTKMSGVNDQWTAPSAFNPTSIGFGWTVFSGENLTIWFDDIALSTTRIGCN